MMLAKAPSPPISLNSAPFTSSSGSGSGSSSSSVAYPFAFRPRLLASRALGARRRRDGGGTRNFAVRSGGYTRTPLETSGAYELIDNETGERFIVWGGSDDPADSPVPPEDVLRWKPTRKRGGGGGGGGGSSGGDAWLRIEFLVTWMV